MTSETPANILLVDDDLRLRGLLETYLNREGFHVLTAGKAQQMDRLLQERPVDLMVLDLMLPGRSGLDICRDLRAGGNSLPILMLTAKGDDIDRIIGLEIGADDYLAKPCNPRELVARVRAVLRRRQAPLPGAPPAAAAPIQVGRFCLQPTTRTLECAGETTTLTTGEFAVLYALVSHPGQTLSRERLLNLARGRERGAFDRSIDVQMSRLRRIIEPDPGKPRYLQTVWGAGYVFRAGYIALNFDRRGLFARTAVLVGVSLLVFSVIAWQVIIWTAMGPATEAAVIALTQRAQAAIEARHAGTSLPAGVRFETGNVPPVPRFIRGFAFSTYVEKVCAALQTSLDSPEVRLTRIAAPSEVWIKERGTDTWLVMSWRLAGPKAPVAAILMLAAAAVVVMFAAAISAQRLTAPLAGLADAAASVANGGKINVDTHSGPAEVRALAAAFQSMAQRLAEVDEQRELMLGGISHDLRTPLARIRVAVELLEHEAPELKTEMTASIEEMDRMIGQFLHYVRANYREVPTLAGLEAVVRGSLGMYATDAGIELRTTAAMPVLFAVECVRHCLLNLVQNALEYGRTPILVMASSTPDEVTVAVQDCGAGLTEAQWLEAIRPFHRLRSPPGQGHSGLGLALIERLVATCHGSVTAQRSAAGFRVTVRLPATRQ